MFYDRFTNLSLRNRDVISLKVRFASMRGCKCEIWSLGRKWDFPPARAGKLLTIIIIIIAVINDYYRRRHHHHCELESPSDECEKIYFEIFRGVSATLLVSCTLVLFSTLQDGQWTRFTLPTRVEPKVLAMYE